MAASILGLPWQQALDDDGVPLAGALLYSYVAGTSTPTSLFSDSDLEIPLTNPVEADAGGFFPVMYMAASGYKLELATSDDVVIRTADNISDPGATFAENFGTAQTTGASLNVTSGYVITATDLFVTVASSGATTINLPAVGTRTQPVCIKNVSTGTVVITPNGSDVIDVGLASFTLEAASTPLFPAVWLYPGTGVWWIFASHRAA